LPTVPGRDLLLEEGQIRRRIEHVVAPVQEPGAVQFDCAEDLDALALAGDRDLRGMADA
jgi:hypothetical protein